MNKKYAIAVFFMAVSCQMCVASGSDDPLTIGQIFTNITEAFRPLGRLMVAVAYMSGLGFFVAAVFKFKQVKDNPTQIPIGTPFALLLVAVLLMFLPGVFGYSAATLFGDSANESDFKGGFEGTNICGLPGEDGSGDCS